MRLVAPIAFTCESCGLTFYVKPHRVRCRKNAIRFCSISCAGMVVRERHSQNKVSTICGRCGRNFKVPLWKSRSGTKPTKYCSRECLRAARATIPKTCATCGAEFRRYTHGRFCSIQCSSMAQRKPRTDATVRHKRLVRKEWYRKNRDKICADTVRRRHEKAEQYKLQRQSHYYANKQQYRDRAKRWRIRYPDAAAIQTEARRCSMANGTLSRQEWIDIKKQYANKCLCCGRSDVKIEMDHVVPISKNGWHSAENIQPLCRSCNAKKGNKSTDYRPIPYRDGTRPLLETIMT